MRKSLMCPPFFLLCVGVAIAAYGQPDPLQEQLDAAVAAHNEAVDGQVAALEEYVRGKIAKAEEDGDFDAVAAYLTALEALSQRTLPSLPQMKGSVRETKSRLLTARNKLESAYEEVVAAYTKNKKHDRARIAREEWEALDGQVPMDSLASAARPMPKAVIPPDAVKYPATGHHYLFVATPTPISWSEAQQRCRDVGGYLACGETVDEFTFIFNLRAGKRCWLGARANGDLWLWTTGTKVLLPPAGKGGANTCFATTRGGLGGRIARPDVPDFVDGYMCEWNE
jgi:hypothetical protein